MVHTQQADGTFGPSVTVPCEPYPRTTSVPTLLTPNENHLPKLRGDFLVLTTLAQYLGVRPAAQLRRLRMAHAALASLA